MELDCFSTNKMSFLWIFVFAIIDQASCAASYNKVVLTNPNAVCLDGTPAAYYVYEGLLTNKWIISFEEGGWCGSSLGATQTLDDCLERSKTFRGSSTSYPNTWQYSEGLHSDNINNQYRDWSRAFFKYCTGTGHQGYRANPVAHNGTNLYFRGHTVTVAQLDSLNTTFNIFNSGATDIIIHGQSAGGLAVFLWANYIRDNTPSSTRVISIVDSGIFLDFKNYQTGNNEFRQIFQNFMSISNSQIQTPATECNAANPTELWKCMFVEFLAPYVKVPLFIVQSAYDSYCVQYILGIKCQSSNSFLKCDEAQMNYIQQHQKSTKTLIEQIATYNPQNGYWAISCSEHILTYNDRLYNRNYRIPGGSSNSIIKGIAQWQKLQPVSYKHMDKLSWPGNLPCSSMQDQQTSFIVLGLMLVVLMLTLKFIYSCLKDRKKYMKDKFEEQAKQPKQDNKQLTNLVSEG